jgi:hypothetical protein
MNVASLPNNALQPTCETHEVVGDLSSRHRPFFQQLKNITSGGISERFEYAVHGSIFSQTSNYQWRLSCVRRSKPT